MPLADGVSGLAFFRSQSFERVVELVVGLGEAGAEDIIEQMYRLNAMVDRARIAVVKYEK